MNMRRVLLAALAASAASSGVFATPIAPRMNGETLLRHYLGPPDVPVLEQDAQSHFNRQLALGYLAGVADNAQGQAWCNSGKVKPGEIDAYVMDALRDMPPAALRANASGLIVALLKQKFPCPTDAGR